MSFAAELRPLSLGELLDRIFSLYRRHLWVFVGIMALPMSTSLGIVFLFPFSQDPFAALRSGPSAAPPPELPGAFFIGMFVYSIIFWVFYAIALGATSLALYDVHLGQPASIRGSYKKVRGQVWRLLDAVFSLLLRVAATFFVSYLGLAVIVLIPLALVKSSTAITVALILIGILLAVTVGVGLAFWLATGYSVVVPALVLEKLTARQALKRSWQLTEGNRGRVFLIFLLTAVIQYAAMAIFQGPFWIAMALAGRDTAAGQVLPYLAGIFGAVAGSFSGPLLMIGLVLLYLDLRVRKEGFDLQMMMGAVDARAAGALRAVAVEKG